MNRKEETNIRIHVCKIHGVRTVCRNVTFTVMLRGIVPFSLDCQAIFVLWHARAFIGVLSHVSCTSVTCLFSDSHSRRKNSSSWVSCFGGPEGFYLFICSFSLAAST